MASNFDESGNFIFTARTGVVFEWDLDFDLVPDPNLVQLSLILPHIAYIPGSAVY